MFGNIFSRDAPQQPNYNAYTDLKEMRDEEVVSFVNARFDDYQKERRIFELQWRLNIAFMEGNQYTDINSAAMTIQEIPKMFEWQEREVFNHIAPNIENRIAKLSRMRPALKVRPGTGEQEDIRASKVGSQLLKNVYYDEGIQDKLSDAFPWMELCGSVLLKNSWNKNKGKILMKYISQNPEAVKEIAEEIREGDIEVVLCPALEFYPDSPYHQDIVNCRRGIHAKIYDLDEIEEIWGVRVSSEETSSLRLQRNMVGIGGLGYGLGGFNFVTARLQNHAVVKEFWEIPTKQFPNGRLLIVAGGKTLYKGPMPYPVGDDGALAMAFTKLDCIIRPGVFWGKTVIERMIPIQRRYNALRNRKAEFLNRCSIGQWTAEENSIDLDYMEANAGAPGAIHVYKRGFNKPEHVQNDQLPTAFETEEQTLLQEMSIVSGVSELSRQSQAPTGVKSGVALSIALEQDDTRLSLTSNNVEQFLIKNGKQWLRLFKAFAKNPRTLRAIGKNNVVDVMDWTASDLRSDDVIIESFSALSESPAQRRQLVFDLMNTPLFQDPNTGQINKEMQSKLLEMIELGNWESGDEEAELHINKAERENRTITQGQLSIPVPYDDHLIHMSRHNKFRLTVDYEQLMAQNPQVDMLFQQHIQMHMFMMVNQFGSPMPALPPEAAPPGQTEGGDALDETA
jgi:hypothetical protein